MNNICLYFSKDMTGNQVFSCLKTAAFWLHPPQSFTWLRPPKITIISPPPPQAFRETKYQHKNQIRSAEL